MIHDVIGVGIDVRDGEILAWSRMMFFIFHVKSMGLLR
jgi:hypothetical protein